MTTAIVNPAGEEISRDRASLYAVLRRSQILRSINIGPTGALSFDTIDWSTYWRSLASLGQPELIATCASLRTAWQAHIESGFARADEYCAQYWQLLEALMASSRARADRAMTAALQAAVAFESFGIGDRHSPRVAAATTTTRNPVYLLARLKWPTVPHSTRFLPLISIDGSRDSFGHYRRYPLEPSGESSLLVFPRNRLGGDLNGLKAIAVLANRLGARSDPFVSQRADRLWTHVVQPLIAQRPREELTSIDFVDIGASSGALTAQLAEKLARWAKKAASTPRFRIPLIDSSDTPLSEHFAEAELRPHIQSLQRTDSNYRRWLVDAPVMPRRRGTRFVLICKLLDMASRFEIGAFENHELPSPPADDSWFSRKHRSPLAWISGENRELLTSSYRFEVADGHVLAQPALSDYFEAMLTTSPRRMRREALHLPVRRFDPSSLDTSGGTSVLAEALRHGDFVIIEDADLRPRELLDHVRRFHLEHGVRIRDVTARMRLTGNHAYVLSVAGGEAVDLGGERLI